MILEFPQGYDTPIRAGQVRLSGGQMQASGSRGRFMMTR